MESNGAPLWAQELRNFTEFSLERLSAKVDSVNDRLSAKIDFVEERLTRKIENMDSRIEARFGVLEADVGEVKSGVREINLKLTNVDQRLAAAERP